MASEETRTALMDAAIRLTSRSGLRSVTARAVATEAGVNQALVFYHFEGVEGLLREAFDRDTKALVASFAAELGSAETFADLHAVGVRLAARSKADGSASLLSQVIAAAHTDPLQAELLAVGLREWQGAVRDAVGRVFAARGLSDLDLDATTGALSAAVIGMITVDSVDGSPLGETLASLSGLALLVDRVLRLVPAPLARRIAGRVV